MIVVLGCKNNQKNSYAIRDFDKSLQPYLRDVVSKGIVGFDSATSFIIDHTTDKELKQLSESEHPVLRAVAFREMLKRKSFDHFKLIMTNLDDTAIVQVDDGEWGINPHIVSDIILDAGMWKNLAERKKTIDEIILHHNYLRSAYYKLDDIKADPIYYDAVREMIQRKRNVDIDNFSEKEFSEMEHALYALAGFKKVEDVQLIKQILLENNWHMGELSFKLLIDYPNESYMEIFEKYFKDSFYYIACKQDASDNLAPQFIKSVASYKNERSARILDSMLNRRPFFPCRPLYLAYSKLGLAYTIWNIKTDAYSKLRRQVEALVKEEEERTRNFEKIEVVEGKSEPQPEPKGPVGWWWR